jgi:hypothetical protein
VRSDQEKELPNIRPEPSYLIVIISGTLISSRFTLTLFCILILVISIPFIPFQFRYAQGQQSFDPLFGDSKLSLGPTG